MADAQQGGDGAQGAAFTIDKGSAARTSAKTHAHAAREQARETGAGDNGIVGNRLSFIAFSTTPCGCSGLTLADETMPALDFG